MNTARAPARPARNLLKSREATRTHEGHTRGTIVATLPSWGLMACRRRKFSNISTAYRLEYFTLSILDALRLWSVSACSPDERYGCGQEWLRAGRRRGARDIVVKVPQQEGRPIRCCRCGAVEHALRVKALKVVAAGGPRATAVCGPVRTSVAHTCASAPAARRKGRAGTRTRFCSQTTSDLTHRPRILSLANGRVELPTTRVSYGRSAADPPHSTDTIRTCNLRIMSPTLCR